jgi:uncharacterized protein YegP (UPF0339 family)
MSGKFEITKAKDGDFHFHLNALTPVKICGLR